MKYEASWQCVNILLWEYIVIICALLQSAWKRAEYSHYTAYKHKPTYTSQYQYYFTQSNLHIRMNIVHVSVLSKNT